MILSVRLGALALGLVVLVPGHVRRFEFALKLEGGAVTYLVLAAPVIAGAAAMHPVLAEATWRERALPQGPPLVGRVGSCGSRRVLLRCRAGPRSEGRSASRAQSLFGVLRLVPRQHSPRPKRAWTRRRAAANQRGLRSSVVLTAGPSSQQRRRRKPTWTLRGGSCSQAESMATTDSPTPGSRVAAPCCPRPRGLHGHLDGLIRRSRATQAGNGEGRDTGQEAQGEAQSTPRTKAGRCQGESRGVLPARGQRQQRRQLPCRVKAKPHRGQPWWGPRVRPVLMSLCATSATC